MYMNLNQILPMTLKSLNNVGLTPHIGNATFEARDMMFKIVANAAISAAQGEKPQFVVN